MNTTQYSILVQPHTTVTTPRARETARRRIAYTHIDAAYRAHRINESARELAKWYVRSCCGVWNYHNLTQTEQAKHYGVARRTIVTLVQQLVHAEVIWLERHGSANRTYIMAYQAPAIDELEPEPEPSFELDEPTYAELRPLLMTHWPVAIPATRRSSPTRPRCCWRAYPTVPARCCFRRHQTILGSPIRCK